MSSDSWQDKQISMIKHSSITIGAGQVVVFSSVFWIFSGSQFFESYTWLILALIASLSTAAFPFLLDHLHKKKNWLQKETIIFSSNILYSLPIFLWSYSTIFGYQYLALEEKYLYTVILVGAASATVATILHNRLVAIFVVSYLLIPYSMASFHSDKRLGHLLSFLSLVYLGVIVNQILILHKIMKKEFKLSEQNRLLLEENQKNTENLVQTSKMVSIGQMAGGVAHEINTPLAVISGSVSIIKSLLKNESLDKKVTVKSLDTIERTVKRIARIISGLKTVSQGSTSAEMESVSIDDVYADVLGLCSEKFKLEDIDLRSNIKSNHRPKTIYCDRIQLSQTLLNILNNAFDVVKELDDKWIEVKFLQSSSETIIQITNSGPQITEELTDKIFDPFYTTKPVGQGTGLGLSISKSIIESQGGKLFVNLKKEHTCFEIRFNKHYDLIYTQKSA